MSHQARPVRDRMKFSELLDMLGYTEGEYLSLCHQVPGHNFMANVVEFDDRTPAKALRYVDDCDLWFGVNPTRRRGDDEGGRGKAEDVTRLAAVWCDLDVKPGACRDLAHAHQIIDDLSAIVGTRPSAVVMSGHGLQPYWPIDDGQIANGDDDPTMQAASEELRAEAAAVLKRWGRLAVMVAEHQGAKIDRGVYDLSRVLRVPGSYNRKGEPVLVTCEADHGAPLTIDELAERLDEAGVTEHEGDRRTVAGEVVSAPDSWEPAAAVCDYFAQTIKAWRDEPITERHNWLVRQAVRIMCGLRNGCLTAGQLDEARKAVVERFEAECAATKRAIPAWEIRNAFAWARDHAARMTDAELATEMGSHLHLWEKAEPRPVTLAPQPAPEQTAGKSAPAQVSPQNGEATANVTLTDTGNAELLVAAWAGRLRWCPEAGKWFAWEGARWRPSPDGGEAMMAAVKVVEAIKVVKGDKDTAKHKMRSLQRRALENMVALAKCRPGMRVSLADLDAEPYALNTPSGVVDLRTGELSPHLPEGWHTKVTGVGYDPRAAAPQWWAFLHRTFGDAELVGYMQRLAGLAATGKVTHHVLPFLFGAGSNGKSVLMDVLGAVLGDYAITAPANFLLAGRDRHETEIARLHGSRLVVCSEINADSKFDEAKVKVLTGGDVLSGRYMRQDFFDFIPSHTLFLMGNHQPQVSAGGTSFWRRLRLIPFQHTVPKEERNPNLAAELIANEGPAILAWIVDGARQVAADGLDEPASVKAATEEYSAEEDALGRFVEECCVLGNQAESTKPAVLLGAYQSWARANGEADMNQIKLGRELSARFGVRSTKSQGVRVYQGLSVLEQWLPQWLGSR
ncbi:DNA primase [Mycobacterium phage Findley]|uniref:DNA primase n=1 Tax=Mycobacterium phage Findley TaxID=2015882 RepID=A0A222ZR81_9CAUD|nr:DNA polymerase/primase [Mycobacterium phage Findley]ASR86812.1 DNA primase [Mycobacterium phage Findley]